MSINVDAKDRREFMKKMTYATPVLTTYFLSETIFADDKDDKEGRARGRTSPHPGRGRDKNDTN